jgi:hypothetical protein
MTWKNAAEFQIQSTAHCAYVTYQAQQLVETTQ